MQEIRDFWLEMTKRIHEIYERDRMQKILAFWFKVTQMIDEIYKRERMQDIPDFWFKVTQMIDEIKRDRMRENRYIWFTVTQRIDLIYERDRMQEIRDFWFKVTQMIDEIYKRERMQEIRDFLMSLKHYTTPSVVKDESTVQNRDKADRSQKVTDMPEELDAHLTKEDVDSIVPQNNRRERIHLSVHQVIVVFLLMTSFTQGISSHCDTSRTMNCTELFMTCSFDTDIIRLAKNIYMNHLQNNSVDLQIIVVCQRSSKGFNCETSPTYEVVSVESNRLTVKIPEVNLEHVGKYWCDVHGLVDIDQKACQLSVTDTSSEDCFQQVNGPSDKDNRFSPAIIAIIVLGPLLVLVVTSIIIICFISSGSAKYIATCFNLKNCKSGIYAPSTITEEECEKL